MKLGSRTVTLWDELKAHDLTVAAAGESCSVPLYQFGNMMCYNFMTCQSGLPTYIAVGKWVRTLDTDGRRLACPADIARSDRPKSLSGGAG
ncbi:MAG: hypothetical protein KME26_02970 [Oscillatoria princeps RMCB-10]|nr:hypothetical protein [Oscillatoria princeps RMCB-10]